jgi:transcriptional regulator with AAA-type ATPase domain
MTDTLDKVSVFFVLSKSELRATRGYLMPRNLFMRYIAMKPKTMPLTYSSNVHVSDELETIYIFRGHYPADFNRAKQQFEREFVAAFLAACNGNKRKCAEHIGIERRQLQRICDRIRQAGEAEVSSQMSCDRFERQDAASTV